MVRLLLPLHHYDLGGRIKPPRFYWISALFLSKAYFIVIVALSLRQETQTILNMFYPRQMDLYFGLASGATAVAAIVLVAFREKWWGGKFVWLARLIKPLLLIALLCDLAYQIHHISITYGKFSWQIAFILLVDMIIFYWLLKSRHLKWMIRDWQ